MLRKTKFYIGLMLMVQAISFLVLFIMLYAKKRSLSTALLLLSVTGGAAGMFIVYRQLTAKADDPEFEAFEEFCFGPKERSDVRILTDDNISEAEFE